METFKPFIVTKEQLIDMQIDSCQISSAMLVLNSEYEKLKRIQCINIGLDLLKKSLSQKELEEVIIVNTKKDVEDILDAAIDMLAKQLGIEEDEE